MLIIINTTVGIALNLYLHNIVVSPCGKCIPLNNRMYKDLLDLF